MNTNKVPEGFCVLCRVEILGRSHNPQPIVENGSCCTNCNQLIVLPHRLRESGASEDAISDYFQQVLIVESALKNEKAVKEMRKAIKSATRSTREDKTKSQYPYGQRGPQATVPWQAAALASAQRRYWAEHDSRTDRTK